MDPAVMTDPTRRSDDSWRSRMEDRLDAAIDRLTAHVSGCEKHQEHEKEWREKTEATIGGIDGKLDRLLTARDRATGAWWMLTKVVAGITALTGGAAWLWDHWKPIAVICALSLSTGALAHDANHDHDAWFSSLKDANGASCCNFQDCKNLPTRVGKNGYEVQVGEDQWVPVPPDKILKRDDNPTGEPVTCWSPYLGILCFIEGTGV